MWKRNSLFSFVKMSKFTHYNFIKCLCEVRCLFGIFSVYLGLEPYIVNILQHDFRMNKTDGTAFRTKNNLYTMRPIFSPSACTTVYSFKKHVVNVVYHIWSYLLNRNRPITNFTRHKHLETFKGMNRPDTEYFTQI